MKLILGTSGRELYAYDAPNLRAALIEAVAAGTDLARADLEDANLAGAYLARADLRGVDLLGAVLLRGAPEARSD